ncbi:MAG: hypothetical protein ACRETM_01180 [Stenotrophobium sp.]
MNPRNLLFICLAIVVLAGLFLLLKPAPQTAVPQTVATQAQQPAPSPAPQVFDIVVRDGRRVAGPALIEVHEGDEVVLRVTCDHDDELHLHGYDLHLQLHAGVPGELKFKAVHSGHFDYELHHLDLELGALNVLPQ